MYVLFLWLSAFTGRRNKLLVKLDTLSLFCSELLDICKFISCSRFLNSTKSACYHILISFILISFYQVQNRSTISRRRENCIFCWETRLLICWHSICYGISVVEIVIQEIMCLQHQQLSEIGSIQVSFSNITCKNLVCFLN